jgi:hypothetical protein
LGIADWGLRLPSVGRAAAIVLQGNYFAGSPQTRPANQLPVFFKESPILSFQKNEDCQQMRLFLPSTENFVQDLIATHGKQQHQIARVPRRFLGREHNGNL